MKRRQKRILAAAGLTTVILFLSAGVFAANNIILNSGDVTNLGAGAQKVDPCDNDVNISAITYNDGENVYLQGFQYDNADKTACVGYDFETRFVSNAGNAVNLFATSSITAEPNLIRIFAPTSSANWQLGLGAQPSVEATVTQLSASSFKVIFTTPIALASEMGRIVMAELTHLPIGDFSAAASAINISGDWQAISANAAATSFYIADQSGRIYKSSQIGSNFSSTTLTAITALPGADGGNWQALAESDSGQYVAAVGYNNRAYFSSDYGQTWDTKTASSYYTRLPTGYNGFISMSADGSKVCMVSSSSSGSTINLWVNYNFYSSANSDYYIDETTGNAKGCTVTPDGSKIFLVVGGNNIYKWNISSLTTRANSLNTPLLASNLDVERLGVSNDGKVVVFGYKRSLNSPKWKYSTDYGATFADSLNTPTTAGANYLVPASIRISRDGRVVAIGTYYGSADYGGVATSTDFGHNFTDSSMVANYVYDLAISTDGSRILAPTHYGTRKVYLLTSK